MNQIMRQIKDLKEDMEFRRKLMHLPECTKDEREEAGAKLRADKAELRRLRRQLRRKIKCQSMVSDYGDATVR